MSIEQLQERNKLIIEIAQKLTKKRLSLYLGAGISVPSNIPGWSTIVKECCKELNIRLSDYEDNYYKLLEYYTIQRGRNALSDKFLKHIKVADVDNNDIVAQLAKLNFNKIWTTNFDNLIHIYHKNNFITSNVINSDEKYTEILSYDGVSVVKLNGDFDVDFQVMTEQDFLNYERHFKNLYLNFQSEIYTHSFLIIGSSLSDGLFLPTLYKLFSNDKPPHKSYCFIQRPLSNRNKVNRHELYVKYLNEIYNISALEFEEFNEIPQILRQIREMSLYCDCFISGSLQQQSRSLQTDLEDKARLFCREMVLNLMNNNMKIHTCFGMLIGNYISFPITSECIKTGQSVNKYLQIYPLDNRATPEEQENFREKIIDKGKFFIAMAGSATQKSGVYKEFLIAKKLNKVVIPIPFLNGCGELIYNEIKTDPAIDTKYPYLHKYMEALGSIDYKIVANAVLKIIKSATSNHYS